MPLKWSECRRIVPDTYLCNKEPSPGELAGSIWDCSIRIVTTKVSNDVSPLFDYIELEDGIVTPVEYGIWAIDQIDDTPRSPNGYGTENAVRVTVTEKDLLKMPGRER